LAAVVTTTLRYGTQRGQVGELWLPRSPRPAAGDVPVVVLVHGGFWRAPYGKRLMRGLARSVTRHGWAAWNIEYRRLGPLGGDGGWPATFVDVAAAVDFLANRDGLDTDRVVTCGHSAGGHLALWLAARSRLGDAAPGGPVQVPVRAAVALAGIADLRRAADLGLGRGAVVELLGGRPPDVPERYDDASPWEQLPLGVPQVLVHGLDDTVVPPEMSEQYVARAQAVGDDARYVPVHGIGHRDLLRSRHAGWAAALGELGRLIPS
jgi:acetyl esterase/lipase